MNRRPELMLDGIECIRCFRQLHGLYVRLLTGICTYCQPVILNNRNRR